ncbi:DUF3052 family protein [Chryseotalea sanaruensis]|uniref:DUF3052 family protein n=1 Tax=Chryseotalea sanaruensis TaxID=2482724 RepID=A0A401UBI7_9BACT|nr:DUF3052 family protein [Chryseotalea sanaruensis]GCC52273.1 DUF3052 family protein [Chryseotalea sanaruensis]
MAGYSSTPLVKKLGLKMGHSIYVNKAPTAYFEWLAPLPDEIAVKTKLSGQLDFIHLFVTHQKDFKESFLKAKIHLKPDAMLWISWPKKASKEPTDLDENVIRDFGLQNGLVDVKVCAVSEVWSGLKFVFRLKDR